MIVKAWDYLRHKYTGRFGKISYSQCGEDLIVDFVLSALRISKASYLDIGAHHPQQLSNTYYFYRHGGHGVCVEPDPRRYEQLRKARPRDLCIQAGITAQASGEAEFYVMSWDTLSTFSKSDAMAIAVEGHGRIKKVLRIPTLTTSELFARYRLPTPDLVSVDVEGHELAVLRSFELDQRRPKVFCVETLTYSENKTERKQQETIDWMKEHEYRLYADTYINSIFVDEQAWRNR